MIKNDSITGATVYTYDRNDRLFKEELTKNGVKVNSIEYGMIMGIRKSVLRRMLITTFWKGLLILGTRKKMTND